MTCISSVDHQTRLDVHELLARFCHYLDHDQPDEWAALFTLDGRFECDAGYSFAGRAELATLPGIVRTCGGGIWRHTVTATTIRRCESRRDLLVEAYGPVIDMARRQTIAGFYDYRFLLHQANGWRIRNVEARRVGDGAALAAVAEAAGRSGAAAA